MKGMDDIYIYMARADVFLRIKASPTDEQKMFRLGMRDYGVENWHLSRLLWAGDAGGSLG